MVRIRGDRTGAENFLLPRYFILLVRENTADLGGSFRIGRCSDSAAVPAAPKSRQFASMSNPLQGGIHRSHRAVPPGWQVPGPPLLT